MTTPKETLSESEIIANLKDKFELTSDNGYEVNPSSPIYILEQHVVEWYRKKNINYNRYILTKIIRTVKTLLDINNQNLGNQVFEDNYGLLLGEHLNNMGSYINVHFIQMVETLKVDKKHIDELTDPYIRNKVKVIVLLGDKYYF